MGPCVGKKEEGFHLFIRSIRRGGRKERGGTRLAAVHIKKEEGSRIFRREGRNGGNMDSDRKSPSPREKKSRRKNLRKPLHRHETKKGFSSSKGEKKENGKRQRIPFIMHQNIAKKGLWCTCVGERERGSK